MSAAPSHIAALGIADRSRELGESNVGGSTRPILAAIWPTTLVVGVAVVTPWQLHARANARIGQAVHDESLPVETDLAASRLSVGPISVSARGAQLRARAVEAFLGQDGLHLDVRGVQRSRFKFATKSRARPRRRVPTRPAETWSTTAYKPPATPRFDVPLPIRIRLYGELEIDTDRPLRATVRDTEFDLLPAGAWRAAASGELISGSHELATFDGQLRAANPEDIGVNATLQPATGPAITLTALHTLGGTRFEAQADGGSLTGRVSANANPSAFDVHVAMEEFPLTGWTALPIAARWRTPFARARASGGVKLTRDEGHWQTSFDDFALLGATFEHHLLAREPLRFDRLALTGTVDRRSGIWAANIHATHGTVPLTATGRLGANTATLDVQLPSAPCQDVLDALPRGLAPLLEGMQLEGTVDAKLRVTLPLDVLEGLPPKGELPEEAPGELELDLPFLERCSVLADAPSIDLSALAGAYNHRFVRADGSAVARVMSIESPAYTPLVQVPQIGRAFVVLEDANFWTHDGFDREQMARAFWYNLGVGRPSRGASTITQQTARNLWLGGARTLARKLQEAVLAARLEQALPKERILELYLNIIELGPGVHGVHEAAHHHFGVDPEDLNLLQSLHLASLAPSPVPLSRRFASGEADREWVTSLREQIRRMQLRGMISKTAAHRGTRESLRLRAHAKTDG